MRKLIIMAFMLISMQVSAYEYCDYKDDACKLRNQMAAESAQRSMDAYLDRQTRKYN